MGSVYVSDLEAPGKWEERPVSKSWPCETVGSTCVSHQQPCHCGISESPEHQRGKRNKAKDHGIFGVNLMTI